jgi:hypothetical protein
MNTFLKAGAALATVALLSACPGPRKGLVEQPPATPSPTPVPTPTPPPTPYVPNRKMEVGKMFNGMKVRTTLETEYGTTAAQDRIDPDSYAIDIQVKVRVPKPHRDLAALAKLNPELPTVLPGLPILLDTAKISPSYDELYRLKTRNLETNLRTRLDNLLSKHNFYDTETVLELEHPVSKRKAILVQSDMDTDMDGSDSDRVPDVDGTSATFQPFTSYNWPKRTEQQNSFIKPRDKRLRDATQELATPSLSAARKKELKDVQALMKSEITNLQKNSFLVAALDPFIVLPGSMFGKKGQLTPSVGDYCVVINGNKLYPAIVGDVGPSYKSGEGSLRLCKELNPSASAYNRASSDLKVTYVVFPGTGDRPWGVPDLQKWRARCEALLADVGGYSGDLHTWPDLTAPKPAAIPADTNPPADGATPSTTTTPAQSTPAPGTPALDNPPAAPTPAASGAPAPATPSPATPAPATPASSRKSA